MSSSPQRLCCGRASETARIPFRKDIDWKFQETEKIELGQKERDIYLSRERKRREGERPGESSSRRECGSGAGSGGGASRRRETRG